MLAVTLCAAVLAGCGDDRSDNTVAASEIRKTLEASDVVVRLTPASPPENVGVQQAVTGTASHGDVSVNFGYVIWDPNRVPSNHEYPWTPAIPNATTRGYGNNNVTFTSDLEFVRMHSRFRRCVDRNEEDPAAVEECYATTEARSFRVLSRTLDREVIERLTPYRQSAP